MASQTLNLSFPGVFTVLVQWRVSEGQISPSVITQFGPDRTVTEIRLVATGIDYGEVTLQLDDDDLSEEFELNASLHFSVGGHEYRFSVPDDAVTPDQTEPYNWVLVPEAIGRLRTFMDEITALAEADRTGTVVLSDETAAGTVVLSGQSLDLALDVSEATIEAEVPVTALVLSDSDDTGLQVDCKALLVASDDATAGNFFYSDADRGGTDEPLDGELGLGADESLISGIRRRTATILQLNDNDSPVTFDISDYFDTGGDGNDLTIYLQTTTGGEVSFPVAGNVDTRNAGQVRFNLPADGQTLLDNLADGERWIFKLARPEPPPEPVVLSGQSLGLELDIARANISVVSVGAVVLQGQPLGLDLDISRANIVAAEAGVVVLSGQALDLGLEVSRANVVVTTVDEVLLQGQPLGLELDVSRARLRFGSDPDDAAFAAAASLQGAAPIYALEITHPDVPDPVRMVADTIEHTIEGNVYPILGFRTTPPQDKENEIRHATLEIDNVGRELVQWVEDSQGGRGAMMRVMRVITVPGSAASEITWEVTMSVGVAELTNETVRVTLSDEPIYDRPCVNLRHDPATSPGLF